MSRQEQPNREVRTLKIGEEKKHFKMLNRCHNPWGSEAKYRRVYHQEGFDATKNVIVVEENGEWVGGVSGWFRQVFVKNEKTVSAYCSGDGYTLSSHRGKGISTLALRTLHRNARERGVALGFGFISILNIAYRIALPKMGFVDAFYPATKVIVLNPNKFFDYVVTEKLKEIKLPARFEKMKMGITISFMCLEQPVKVGRKYQVKNGKLEQITLELGRLEKEKSDLEIKADAETFANVFINFYSTRKMLLALLKAILWRRLKLRFSLRFLRAAARGLA